MRCLEDLTFDYLDRSDVYFVNQYRLGEALIRFLKLRTMLENSSKIYPDLVKRMSTSGKTGFYFRSIKTRLCIQMISFT